MSYPVYQVPAGDVLPIFFSTYDGGTGASLTMTGLAVTDIEIYKDGSVTQRASDAGYTLLDTDGIDFDALTGIHGFSIDTGDNTDASFYTVGAWFHVVVSAITVDAQTVSFIAAAFRLMAAESVAGKPKVDVDAWLGTAAATPTVAGVPEVDVTHFGGSAGTFASGVAAVNATQVSGDATAADNLELAFDGTGYAGGTTPQQVVLTTSGNNAVADQVWDEAASGHVASGSFGQRSNIIRAATAQAGDATHITLDASASAVDDFYNNQQIFITAGTGVGQGRIMSDYVGATKVAEVATWVTNPSSDSVFVITPFGSIPGASAPTAGEVADAVWDEALSGHTTSGTSGEALGGTILRTATAQAGGASSITLDASASATNDLYNYNIISIIGGTGAGQSRQISDYVGSSKVATVSLAWITNPSSDSVFQIIALGVDAATVASIADGIWDEARAGHVAAGSFGEYVLADATRLSGDATAADNAESFFDGTGYAGTGNVIPSVTTVTGNVTGNVGGNVTGSVGSLATQAKADVNAEADTALVDVGLTTTITGRIDAAVTTRATPAQVNTEVVDALTVDVVADAIPADGSRPTIAQAAYMLTQFMLERSVTGTTVTVNKPDGTTALFSLTLDDATTPTAITRSA